MKSCILPKRWHIYSVDLEPRIGTKPGKQRPCLAIQPDEISEAGLGSTVVIPLTINIIKNDAYPLRVRIPCGVGGVNRESDLIIDQILAWDNSLFVEEIGMLPDFLQEKTKRAIVDFLDLT